VFFFLCSRVIANNKKTPQIGVFFVYKNMSGMPYLY